MIEPRKLGVCFRQMVTLHSLSILFNFFIPTVLDWTLTTRTGLQDVILKVCSQAPSDASTWSALAFSLQCIATEPPAL